MTRKGIDLDSVEKLDIVEARLAAGRSVDSAGDGKFEDLIARLREGIGLADIERKFLADLLAGDLDFEVKRKDGRRRPRRDLDREKEIATFVQLRLDSGATEHDAMAAADAAFRADQGERIASIRRAHERWYPKLGRDLPELEA